MREEKIVEQLEFYEKAKYDLTWRICLLFFCLLPILYSSLFYFEESVAIPTFIGWLVTILMLVILKRTRTYRIAAFLFSILGIILCNVTLLAFPEAYHFVDSLWMIAIILYTYFTLGKFWGNLALIINMIGIVVFILFFLNLSLDLIPVLSQGELISHTLNVIICGLCIAYLIYQFLHTTNFARDKYIQLTSQLQVKNDEVQFQNEEKTVMLREIHHRVKNNLQVITSLLRLQSRELSDEKTVELFKDATNRVVAMALIHDKMYQSKDMAKINLEDYLSTLLNDLIDSYSVEIPIKADIVSTVETITNQSLVPLALLFNELVSNSLKHGFSSQVEGRVKIIIDRTKDADGKKQIQLTYWDNGVWREKQKDTSFGLELIESLTEQLDGKYTRSIKQGTSYEFILPDNL